MPTSRTMSDGNLEFKIPWREADELLLCVLLGPLIVTEIRVPYDEYVWATDASSFPRGSVVRAHVGAAVSEELLLATQKAKALGLEGFLFQHAF